MRRPEQGNLPYSGRVRRFLVAIAVNQRAAFYVRTRGQIRDTTNAIRKTTKRTCAIPDAAPAIPPKPRSAAINAMIRNVIAQESMTLPFQSVRSFGTDRVEVHDSCQKRFAFQFHSQLMAWHIFGVLEKHHTPLEEFGTGRTRCRLSAQRSEHRCPSRFAQVASRYPQSMAGTQAGRLRRPVRIRRRFAPPRSNRHSERNEQPTED